MSQENQHTNDVVESTQEQENINSLQAHCPDLSLANWTDKNGDIFEREQYADQLSGLIKNTTCPYVIALSSPWGTGKTYFLNAWKNKIDWHSAEEIASTEAAKNTEIVENSAIVDDTNKIPCVYFSAWDSEYIDDPMLALTGNIKNQLQDLLGEDNTLIEGLKDSAAELFTAQNALKVTSKLITGFIDKQTNGALSEIAKDTIDTIGKNCLQAKKCPDKITEFKNALQEIVKKIQEITDSKTPILIMIDELDRCKPDYVIKLLERIKHLFSIPGLVFILAIDHNQLLSIVEHTFGLKKDENEAIDYRQIYLEKFIDLFYALPEPDKKQYAKYLIIKNCSQAPKGLFQTVHDKEDTPYGSENELYDQLLFHQQMYLQIIETAHLSSLRNLEKKFYKFLTIYTAYKPDFICTIFLLLLIMNSDKKDTTDNLIIKDYLETKCPNGLNRIDQRRYLIIEYIHASLSKNHGYALKYDFSWFIDAMNFGQTLNKYENANMVTKETNHMLNFGKNINAK